LKRRSRLAARSEFNLQANQIDRHHASADIVPRTELLTLGLSIVIQINLGTYRSPL
jgi:hypothetical protein